MSRNLRGEMKVVIKEDMSIIRRLFFQCASTIKIQLSVLV
jgi:hypothetical protein